MRSNAEPVDGSAELIHQRGAEQIRVAHHPGLVGIIQLALGGGEQVARRELQRGGPEVVSANISSEQRVLGAGLPIAAADILIFVDVGI